MPRSHSSARFGIAASASDLYPNAIYSSPQVEQLWYKSAGEFVRADKIASETDAVFRICSMVDGTEYLLRISDSGQTFVDYQASLLKHVEADCPSLPVPRIRNSEIGAAFSSARPRRRCHAALATSFLSGQPAAHFRQSAALQEKTYKNLALLDKSLAGFSHPESRRKILWDVSRADQVLPMIECVDNSDLRAQAGRAIEAWLECSRDLSNLRQQVIHNDFNPSNLLVSQDGEISGIIDFGDALHAPLICDLATAIAYQSSESGFEHLVKNAVEAYNMHFSLHTAETEILPVLVKARAAMVASVAHWRARKVPANRSYLLRNVPHAAALLAQAERSESIGTNAGRKNKENSR